ncbi:MAG: hypothetical protein SGJ27_00625 [Candidatus Melainabacteria bacterium]|nr:hypothetical protein [Candidatus Melainabacteria bacterium]
MLKESTKDTKNWPDLAVGLFERLTGLGAEITYDMRDIEVQVPNKVGSDAEHTMWRVNGVLNIRTCESGDLTAGGHE